MSLDNQHGRYARPSHEGWSGRCASAHHKICSGKKGSCECPCHKTVSRKCEK